MIIRKNGFTIFFAVLVSSLALAVGLAIYDLLSRELALSQTATQSQYAIYAADTGAECALYWDQKCPTSGGPAYCAISNGSAFASSSINNTVSVPSSGITCVTQDVAAHGGAPSTFALPTSGWTTWNTSDASSTGAATTFTVMLGTTAASPCALVSVNKFSVGGQPSQTNIVSHGFNTCSNAGVVRLERALRVSY